MRRQGGFVRTRDRTEEVTVEDVEEDDDDDDEEEEEEEEEDGEEEEDYETNAISPFLFKKPEFFYEFHFNQFAWQSLEPKSSTSCAKLTVWANTSSVYTEEFMSVENFSLKSLDENYSHAILTHSSLSMDSLLVNMNPTIHLGFAVDALLQQKEAWTNSRDPPHRERVYGPPTPNFTHATVYVEGSSSYQRYLTLQHQHKLQQQQQQQQHEAGAARHDHHHHHRHKHHNHHNHHHTHKESHKHPSTHTTLLPSSVPAKEALSTLKIKLNRFDVATHVMYEGLLLHKFATVSLEGLEVLVDSRLSHQKVCAKITEYDTNSFTPGLEYTGINGGYVKLKAGEFYISFNMMTKKYLSVSNMAMEGYLYMASVKDKRITVQEKYLCLSDSHLRIFREFSAKTHRNGGLDPQSPPKSSVGSSDAQQGRPKTHAYRRKTRDGATLHSSGSVEDDNQSKDAAYLIDNSLSKSEQAPSHVDETAEFRDQQNTVNTFVEAGLLGYSCPTLRGLVVQNPAQAKIYTKLHVNLPYVENFQDVETEKYLMAYMDDLFNHCLPPSTDPSPPLMWWDSLRYWLHGQSTIVIKKMVYSQARQVSQGLNAPLTLEVSMRKLFIFFDRQAFELNGSDLIITVESKDTQKNMLSMRRVTSRRALAEPSRSGGSGGSSRGGFSRPKLQPPKQILRWKLCNIPCFSVSIANTPATYHSDNTPNNVFSRGVYDHHDVYCRPAFEDTYINRKTLGNFDKFAHFRMKRKSSKWGMLINFSDSPDNVILLFFRLDIIERLKVAFTANPLDVADDTFHQIVTLQEETQNFLFGDNHEHEQRDGRTALLSKEAEAERKQLYLSVRKHYADSLVNDITMCITDLDLHLKLDKFLACSWPSSLILDGAVFSQDSLRVDMQLVNRDVEGGELDVMGEPSSQQEGRCRAETETVNNLGGGREGVDCDPNSTLLLLKHPESSLQLKHIDGNIERIEVYLREWRVVHEPIHGLAGLGAAAAGLGGRRGGQSSARSRESFFHVPQSAGECHTIQHIRGLFEPIYKLAHATRIEFKYDDDISSSNNNCSTVLLPPLRQEEIGVEEEEEGGREGATSPHHVIATGTSSSLPFVPQEKQTELQTEQQTNMAIFTMLQRNWFCHDKKRPQLLSFRTNHALCRPPDSSLPPLSQTGTSTASSTGTVGTGSGTWDQPTRPLPAHALDMVNSFISRSVKLNKSKRQLMMREAARASSISLKSSSNSVGPRGMILGSHGSSRSIQQSGRLLRLTSDGGLEEGGSSDTTGDPSPSIGQQMRIAGLIIVDIRLLWTCSLRDNVSIFYNQVSECLATNAPVVSSGDPPSTNSYATITANAMTPFPCGLPDPGVEAKKLLARKNSQELQDNPLLPTFNHREMTKFRRTQSIDTANRGAATESGGSGSGDKRASQRQRRATASSSASADTSSVMQLKAQLRLDSGTGRAVDYEDDTSSSVHDWDSERNRSRQKSINRTESVDSIIPSLSSRSLSPSSSPSSALSFRKSSLSPPSRPHSFKGFEREDTETGGHIDSSGNVSDLMRSHVDSLEQHTSLNSSSSDICGRPRSDSISVNVRDKHHHSHRRASTSSDTSRGGIVSFTRNKGDVLSPLQSNNSLPRSVSLDANDSGSGSGSGNGRGDGYGILGVSPSPRRYSSTDSNPISPIPLSPSPSLVSTTSSPARTPQRKKSDVATMADIRKFNPNMILEGVEEDEDPEHRHGGELSTTSHHKHTHTSLTSGSEYGTPLNKPAFDVYGNMIVADSSASGGGGQGKHKKKPTTLGTGGRAGALLHRRENTHSSETTTVDVLKFFRLDKEHTSMHMQPDATNHIDDSNSGVLLHTPPTTKRKSMTRVRRDSSVGKRGASALGTRQRRSSVMNMSLSQKSIPLSSPLASPLLTDKSISSPPEGYGALLSTSSSSHPPRSSPTSAGTATIAPATPSSAWVTPEGGGVSTDHSFTPSPIPSLNQAEINREKFKSQQQKTANEKEKEMSKNIPRKYFTLELKNPQVNFLDQKSQSSMLIVVAGKSTVEGRRHRDATVTVHGGGEIEAPKRKNDIELHMDGVSAYTVSTCDEEAEVYNRVFWKALDHTKIDISQRNGGEIFNIGERRAKAGEGGRRRNKSSIHTNNVSDSSGGGLAMAIEHFQIRFFHTFYEDITIMEAMKMNASDFQQTKEDLMSSFFLDLPELCLKVDPLQFYIVLKVIRNVLLAPPPKQSAEEKDTTINSGRDAQTLSKRSSTVGAGTGTGAGEPKASTLHLKSSRARKELREIIEKELISVHTEFSLAQHIEFFVGRGTWLMCDTGSSKVMLEVGFMGFFGRHQNHEDLSSSSEIELQRFWIRDCIGNSMDSAAPTPPPQESIYARIHQQSNRAMTDVKKRLTSKQKQQAEEAERQRKLSQTTWALMPWLEKKDYCMRCGKAFNVKENSSDSCRFHADSEGTLGEYKEYTVYTSGAGAGAEAGLEKTCAWSCCLNPLRTAVGCSVRPHLCQEVMVSIRTESRPSISIANMFDFTVIEKLDIDIFPGAAYVIKIIITKQLVDMLHKYFYFNGDDIEKMKREKEKDKDDKEDLAGEKNGTKHAKKNNHSDKNTSDSESETSSKGRNNKSRKTKSKSSDDAKDRSRDKDRDRDSDTGSVRSGGSKRQDAYSKGGYDEDKDNKDGLEESIDDDGVQAKKTLQEAVYIRQYLRVGEINVEVSTVGFALNLTEYQAVIDYYDDLRGDVLLWSDVMGKLEYHAMWSVTKHTATNGINRLWEAIVGREEESGLLDEDEEKSKVKLLLGASSTVYH